MREVKLNIDKKNFLLYLVSDSSRLKKNETLDYVVEQALKGGVTFLQYREKNLKGDLLKNEALSLKKLAKKYKIPFVVNDNVGLAKEIDADGCHIGQDDMNVKEARKFLGENKIIGASVFNVAQAEVAIKEGCDYLGVGTIFPTSSKNDAKSVSFDELKKIAEFSSVPVIAIGGINEKNILKLKGFSLSGVAVISAILGAENIENSAKNLLTSAKEIFI